MFVSLIGDFMNDFSGTKEKIINVSIELFSQKGFFETSVREISDAAGIKPSSLYNHFVGKEEILNVILDYYKSEINKVKIPDGMIEEIVDSFPPEVIFSKCFERIKELLAPPKMEKIDCIILNEIYKNKKVRDFAKVYLNENRESTFKVFRRMYDKDMIKKYDPEFLSYTFNALITTYSQERHLNKTEMLDTQELDNKINKYIDIFIDIFKK
jgi:AcrR family transcriptional regulator